MTQYTMVQVSIEEFQRISCNKSDTVVVVIPRLFAVLEDGTILTYPKIEPNQKFMITVWCGQKEREE